jgi:outer membrane protein, multidrug efflux system
MALECFRHRSLARTTRWALQAALVGLLAACSLEPIYVAPRLPVNDQWPLPERTAEGPASATAAHAPLGAAAAASDVGWRDFFVDVRLQALIAQALANNRDLRVAVLNVARARAQYRIQRADRLPSVDAGGGYTHARLPPALSGGPQSSISQDYQVNLGVAAFELDLVGRVRSLGHAALERYLAQDEARRGAQLSLIAEVANAYLTLASDRQSLKLANDTFKSQGDSFELTRKRYGKGAASGLDVAQAQTTLESARADVARFEGSVARDIDALTLLVGGPIASELLAQRSDAPVVGVFDLPVGLPSTVLLRRPDALAAEHTLRAAHADIGAARAALFPRISLTAAAGSASEQLSGLLKAGTASWTFAPQASLPIFNAGRLQADLDSSQVDRDVALAQYEKVIQSGFREVADALALSGSLARERDAARALALASARAYQLSESRYEAGRDSYLVVLDSQRSSYAAQQRLIAADLAEQSNRVALYKALGGGWLERGR